MGDSRPPFLPHGGLPPPIPPAPRPLYGAQHTEDPLQRWDDMERDIDLGLDGYLTLRFPAWLVRANPEYVARRILEALCKAGYRADNRRITPLPAPPVR